MVKRPDDGKLEIAIDWLENYESLDPECEAYVACQDGGRVAHRAAG